MAPDRKPDQTPVTLADRSAEQAIRSVFSTKSPGIPIFGEEFGGERATTGLLWVIDPIDGTKAFLTGRPLFTTLISLLRDGNPILGLVDQPITRERWIGVAGDTTRFQSPFGGTVGCRECSDLGLAEVSSTSPDLFDLKEIGRFNRLQARSARTTWGGDAYSYGLLALGLIDIVVESDLKPWDWSALVPVVRGAGGWIGDWQGNPLTLSSLGQVLAVGDPRLLADVVSILSG